MNAPGAGDSAESPARFEPAKALFVVEARSQQR
jgi:hypothetical protein